MRPIRHTLSSGSTFLMKVLLPTFWIGITTFITVTLFFWPGVWDDPKVTNPSFKWISLLVAGTGTLYMWWSNVRLKRVGLDDQSLYISNYLTEIAVPLANVANVTELRWLSTHLITIDFLTDTEFGSRVVFLPRWVGGPLSPQPFPHPVVEEIRTTVRKITGRAPGGVNGPGDR